MDRKQERLIEWACQKLMRRYYYFVDRYEYENAAALFTDDGQGCRRDSRGNLVLSQYLFLAASPHRQLGRRLTVRRSKPGLRSLRGIAANIRRLENVAPQGTGHLPQQGRGIAARDLGRRRRAAHGAEDLERLTALFPTATQVRLCRPLPGTRR